MSPRRAAAASPRRAQPPVADDSLEAHERARVSALKLQLQEHHPFWGYLLLTTRIVLDRALPCIAATDCLRTIWLNPLRTQALTMGQLGFALAHELGHHVYATLQRGAGREHRRWNRATDYAINRIVADITPAGGPAHARLYEVIPGILLDRSFDGLIAEAIYERLAAAEAGGATRTGRGASAGAGGAPSSDDDGAGADGAGGEGGDGDTVTVGGVRVRGHGGGIDVHLPLPMDDASREAREERMRAAVGAHEAAGQRGHAPADAVRAFSPTAPKIPWQRVLRQFAQPALDLDELDPRRLHRRWLTEGLLLPGRSGERVPEIVVALDTSGSMSADTLRAACAEIRGIAGAAARLHLVVADATVQEALTEDTLDAWLRRGRARGGGGTDHRPVFAWMAERRLHPDLFIGLTDLHSAFPPVRPTFPVIWLCPARSGAPPWGRKIILA